MYNPLKNNCQHLTTVKIVIGGSVNVEVTALRCLECNTIFNKKIDY